MDDPRADPAPPYPPSPAQFCRRYLAAVERAARAGPAPAPDPRRLDARRMLLGWFGEHDALPAGDFERVLRERREHTTSAALRAIYAEVLALWRAELAAAGVSRAAPSAPRPAAPRPR